MATNVDDIYELSRRQDAETEQEIMASQEQELVEAQMLAQQAQQTPEAPQDADPSGEPLEVGAITDEEMNQRSLLGKASTVRNDMIKAVPRGVPSALATGVDNGMRMLNSAAEYLGQPGLAVFEDTTLRDAFDDTFGEPVTAAGDMTQFVAGQLGLILSGSAALNISSYFGRALALPAAIGTATRNPDDPNTFNVLNEAFDTQMFDALAHNADDSTVDGIIKNVVEESVIGVVAEALRPTVVKAVAKRVAGPVRSVFKKVHAFRAEREAISEAARISGSQVDTALDQAAEAVVGARAEAEILDDLVEQLDEVTTAAKTQADEAAEVAAFRGADDASVPVSEAQISEAMDLFKMDRNAAIRHVRQMNALETDDTFYQELGTTLGGVSHVAEADIPRVARAYALSEEAGDFALDEMMERLSTPPGEGIGTFSTQSVFNHPDAPEAVRFADELKGAIRGALDDRAARRPVDLDAPPSVPQKFDASVRAKKAEVEAKVAQAEGKLIEAAENTTADGRVIEATRQSLNKDVPLSREADEALGRAADANIPQTTAKEMVKINHLQIGKEELDFIHESVNSGDFDAIVNSLSTLFDATNYDKVAAPENAKKMMKVMHQLFADSPLSHTLQSIQPREVTEARALEMLDEISWIHGGNLNKMVEHVKGLLPDTNLAELSALIDGVTGAVAERAWREAIALGPDLEAAPTASVLRAYQYQILLANLMNDMTGFSSNLGRGLNMRQQKVFSPDFAEILQAARNSTSAMLDDNLGIPGGLEEVYKSVKRMQLMDNPRTFAREASAMMDHTLNDTFYYRYFGNLLSSTVTFSKNIIGGMVQGLALNPTNKLFESATMAVIERDPQKFKIASGYIQGMFHGMRAAFIGASSMKQAFDFSPGLRNPFRHGNLAAAGRQGLKVTGTPHAKFMRLSESGRSQVGLMRTKAKADLLRRGNPLELTANVKVRTVGPGTWFPVPQKRLDQYADYLEQRSGVWAKVSDWYGRAYELPFKGLAIGDEFFSSISYHAQLRAAAVEHIQDAGLEGIAAKVEIERLTREVPRWEHIAKNADPDDVAQVERLALLERLHLQAIEHADTTTFTDEPGRLTKGAIGFIEAVPAGRIVVPFLRTVSRIGVAGVRDYTIAGPTRDLVSAGLKKDRRAAEKALGRTIAAGGFMFSVWNMLDNGMITGGGSNNPDEAKAEKDLGFVPYSIKLPGLGPIRYDPLDPIGIGLALVAEMHKAANRTGSKEFGEIAEDAIGAFAKLLQHKSYLEGLSNFTKMIEDAGRGDGFGKYGRRLVVNAVHNSTVPFAREWANLRRNGLPLPDSWVQQNPEDNTILHHFKDFVRGDKTIYNVQDEVEGLEGMWIQFGSQLQGQLPTGFSDAIGAIWHRTVETRMEREQFPSRDLFGDVRLMPGGLGPDAISGLFHHDREKFEDPLREELRRLGLGYNVDRMFNTIENVKLSPSQQERLHMHFAHPVSPITGEKLPSFESELRQALFESDGKTLREDWRLASDTFEDVAGTKEEAVRGWMLKRLDAAKELFMREELARDEELLRESGSAEPFLPGGFLHKLMQTKYEAELRQDQPGLEKLITLREERGDAPLSPTELQEAIKALELQRREQAANRNRGIPGFNF